MNALSSERSNEALEILASILPEAIIGIDAEGHVELWNSAASVIFGWTEEDVLDKPLPAGIGFIHATHFEANEPVMSKAGVPVDVGFRTSHLSGAGTLLVAFDKRKAHAESRMSELLGSRA